MKSFLDGDFDAAPAAFEKDTSAEGLFRHGVALRARAESKTRRPNDAQSSVVMWQKALALNPNRYIWRRRIQPYGPRLTKPYNFYGWVQEARAEIEKRGETPLPLAVEPKGAELMDRGVVGADALPDTARRAGLRTLECEIEIDPAARDGELKIPGYALYDVCVKTDGTCVFLRQEFALTVNVKRWPSQNLSERVRCFAWN